MKLRSSLITGRPHGLPLRRRAPWRLPAGVALALVLNACSAPRAPTLASLPGPSDLPFIYKIDVQQGNVVTQDMIGQLQRGMDKKQVNFVMGTPIIQDTFNSDRWDYIYTFKPGRGKSERRRVTLVFADEKLDRVEGDVVPAKGRIIVDTRQDTTVEVPLYKKKTMVAKLRDSIPFVDPAEPKYEYSLPEAELEEEEEVASEEEETDELEAATVTPKKSVTVPRNAPRKLKKKGFFARIFDGIGIGADEDEPDREYDPGDPKYRDITNPDDL